MARSRHIADSSAAGAAEGAPHVCDIVSGRAARRFPRLAANDNRGHRKTWRWIAAASAAVFAVLYILFAAHGARAAEIAGKDRLIPTSVRQVRATEFKAPGNAKRPIVMMLHGGAGWGTGDKLAPVDHYASELANRGFDAYLIYYYDDADAKVMADEKTRGGYTAKRFPAWAALLSEIAAQLRKNPDANGRVGFVGFSNGGNLSAHATPLDPSIDCAVIYYGGVSRTPDFKPTRFPPLLIMHGEADTRQPMALGKALYDQAKALGADAQFVTYPGENHGFGEDLNRKAAADAFERAVVFLDKNLKT